MKLSQLIQDVDPVYVTAAGSTVIKGISIDSRTCSSGDLFVVRKGFHHDGGRFVFEAQSNGAAAFLSEVPLKDVPFVQVSDVRVAQSILARRFYGEPDRQLSLVGITGTNGKTTTAHIARHLFSRDGRCGLMGTVETDDGNRTETAGLTTPESHDVFRLLRQMADNGCSRAVMEVSAHGLTLKRVYGMNFACAAFTNLSVDHMDFYGDMETYLAAKLELFRMLSANNPAVIHADDTSAPVVSEACNGPVILVGSSPDHDVCLKETTARNGGQRIILQVGRQDLVFQLPIPGRHNAVNAAMAVGILMGLGLDPAVYVERMESVPPVPGRLQPIQPGGEISCYVDFAHTPDGLDNVLNALREATAGRVICVFGCGGDRDRTKRPLMVSAVCRWADLVFATSDNPRTESQEQIFADMRAGETHGRDVHYIQERRIAIREAVMCARPGDTVLVAGKGHESYQIVGRERLEFDDAEEIRRALRERTHADA